MDRSFEETKMMEKCVCDTTEDTKEKEGHTYMQWFIAIISNTTLLIYGLHIGWVSPSSKILQSDASPVGIPLSDSELSWMASSSSISAAVCVVGYAYFADRFGRKPCIIAICIVYLLSFLLQIFATSVMGLLLSRILGGVAAGGCFNVIPIYTKEISQDDIRGLLGSLTMMNMHFGVFVMYALGSYLDYVTVLWIALAVPVVIGLLMLRAPESPAFLVKIGEVDKATAVIASLRGLDANNKRVQQEIDSLKTSDAYYKSKPESSFFSIYTNRAWRRSFIVSMAMMSINAFSGTLAILTYASPLLDSLGVTFNPELQTLSFPAIMIVGAFVSMSCVERFGRKPLLATTLLLLVVSMLTIGTSFVLQQQGVIVPKWLPVLAIMVSQFSYALGAVSLPYIIMAELFNFQIRAKVFGVIVTYVWLIIFTQVFTYNTIAQGLGAHSPFFIYAAVNLLGIFIVLVLLPETKGKTVEEIEIAMGSQNRKLKTKRKNTNRR